MMAEGLGVRPTSGQARTSGSEVLAQQRHWHRCGSAWQTDCLLAFLGISGLAAVGAGVRGCERVRAILGGV
jgi:hypothetical protein